MDLGWLIGASMLVFLMQAGFLCLETGKIRSKNSINVAAKNIADFILASMIFWAIGFGFMFGNSFIGIFGTTEHFFGADNSPYEISFFFFQTMFCGTAATIVSGAVAERMPFISYLFVTIVLSALIYPITGHWSWASAYSETSGWLENIGFIDFAGSTVVHSVGGWVALAALLIVGPRIGRFDSGRPMPVGSNLPLAALGTLFLWLGWFGFNAGSTLALNDSVPLILLNTNIAAAFSGFTTITLFYLRNRYFDVTYMLNGIIAGLVSITAACHAVTPAESALIGIVGGVILWFGTNLMAKLKLDDALGVVPTHLMAGIWGTLCVALFGDLDALGTTLTRWELLIAQITGIVAIGAYAFAVSYTAFRCIRPFVPFRVNTDEEIVGMNISEHQASTELIDLLSSMQAQEQQAEFSNPVPEEPFTEVGQIAKQYNLVIERVNQEINKRDGAIHQFRSSEKRKTAILDSSMDAIISIDESGSIIEFNPAAERSLGCLRHQVKGRSFINLFILPEHRDNVNNSLSNRFVKADGLLLNKRNTITLSRYSGDTFPAEITITGVNILEQANSEFTLHIRDITRQLGLQNKLKQLAYSDPLTGLYNRTFLLDKLNYSLKHSTGMQRVAIYFLDLDRFKKINDTLGHKAGDELLQEVASRLIRVTREEDVIARWGGDEFVIMICGEFTDDVVRKRAETILNVMRESINIAGSELNILTSVGVAVSIDASSTGELLLQQADIAMYNAKQNGRDNFKMFEPEMAVQAARDFNYEQMLRAALQHENELSLVYQAKWNATKEIIGLESLIRWQHPTEGAISPAEFIPLAEESDLIIAVGEYTIKHAIRDLVNWRNHGLQLLPVALNISGRHLTSGKLVDFVENLLDEFAIDGKFLEFEITEGVLLTDLESCIEAMARLKQLNIRISIDDFGTGYSSLSYLKRLPIDVLKIDRSFVNECDVSTEDGQICATIINLANNLELTTVAEGVETQAQYEFLTRHGCHLFQGFFFHRPEPAEAILKRLIRQQNVLSALSVK